MQTGCGDRILSEKQHNTENRMNDSYQSLEQAIKKAIPLLGMLPEDDYVIGDFDLLPTIDGEHFWNGNYNNGNLCHAKKYYISGGFIPFDSPMCLFPSEMASLLSSERIEYYKERLSEGNHYPRAIAYYISGGMTVLLDGHHKVTAAATIGQRE